jgi:nucleoside 2-deoxyribosyltransferase
MLVYLAGRIKGRTYDEAQDWRKEAGKWLYTIGIEYADPLRGKELLAIEMDGKPIQDAHHGGGPLRTPDAIFRRDKWDVHRANALLINFLDAEDVSIGTCFEVAWAEARGIPIVIVMEDNNIHQHTFIKKSATCIVDNLDEGLHVIANILGR